MNRPLLQFCLTFILGVLSGFLYPLPAGLILAVSVFLFVSAVIFYRLKSNLVNGIMVLLCFSLGIVNASAAGEDGNNLLVKFAGKPVTVVGAVIKEPDVRPGKVFYLLEVQKLYTRDGVLPVRELIRVAAYKPEKIFQYGDVIKIKGEIRTVPSPGNPGQFDYRRYLERRGIYAVMFVWPGQSIEKVGAAHNTGFKGMALSLKGKLQTVLDRTLPPAQSALVQGMLFGSRGMIDNQTAADFQTASLIHVLCVSGFHVGLVLAAFMGLCCLLRLPPAWEAPLGTLVLLLYAAMTGMGPAVMRAAVMGLVALWARRLGRERDWPTAMALAAVIILIFWPAALWEPGFQLSFAVTWGILYLTPLAQQFLKPLPKIVRPVLAAVLVAELTAAPLVVYHFNMVSLVGAAANILAAPLVLLVMLLSGISVVVGLFSAPLAHIINAATGVLLNLMLWMVHNLASVPHAALFFSSPPWWLVAAFYFLLALLPRWLMLSRDERDEMPGLRRYRLLVLLLAVTVLFAWPLGGNQSHLRVHFIDVGQGDAALVQTPNGRNVLIDAGGWKDEFDKKTGAGSRVVLPYLKSLGVNRLDVLILSHPHEDHAGGATGIIGHLPVRLVITAPVKTGAEDGWEMPDEGYMRLLSAFKDKGVPVQAACSGDILKLDDDVNIKIIAPDGPKSSLNDGSLVVKITYRRISFLFTGDIEEHQQRLLAGDNIDLSADILKVPHHGSGFFDVQFFKAVSPRAAVISVGENNKFGHPAPAAIKALEDLNALVYRTDIHGAVIVSTDGESVWIDTGRKYEH
ncbi:competence protein ComEC [Desulfohalotomaculum tongense]|uniref:DNA internalization-related competence protein ComEC/Rec2 n=1 Tax=Desulforadius tongensis TaxID=1216062 RepID=UPI00195E0551|nr:DNA internalization-related competence protein ComEC/Rec2 [Desulforadius tongensis]MBM7855696.1 competence protein ComEC [Desulforadius tongensis]